MIDGAGLGFQVLIYIKRKLLLFMKIQCLVIIKPDGLLHYGGGYTPQIGFSVKIICLQELRDIILIYFDNADIHGAQVNAFKR